MANLASLLDHQAIRKPDHPAIVEKIAEIMEAERTPSKFYPAK